MAEFVDSAPQADAGFNIASYLPFMAQRAPDRPAIIMAKGLAAVSFAELESISNRLANGLSGMGITPGMRVLVMVRPGVEFIALMFALFKMGAPPVLIDPGMGLGRLLDCIRQVEIDAFIGVPAAQAIRVFKNRVFRSVRYIVTVGRRWFWGGPTLAQLERGAADRFTAVPTRRDEAAAILFTSGSTGPAKGVVYEHGMFDAQVRVIQSQYEIQEGEVDLSGFAPFALFSVAMGMTSIVPDMDFSRPGRVDPAKIVEAIGHFEVTNTFGSPAMWRRVAGYCLEREIRLPSLRRVLIAGAPVSRQLIEQVRGLLAARADVHTPYGATEAMPVTSISGAERNAETEGTKASRRTSGHEGTKAPLTLRVKGRLRDEGTKGSAIPDAHVGTGICVGRVLPAMDARLIRISDKPIPLWSDELLVPDGEVGEIVVSGPVVTKEYFNLPQADAMAKIGEGDRIWHRMGDVAYLDADGELWFCGRKAHRVVTERGTLFSVCCEQVFNEHPAVFRSALVGVGPRGHQIAALVVEPQPAHFPRTRRLAESFRIALLALGQAHSLTQGIEHILFHRGFPVDVRHNTKIDRESLAVWVAKRLV